MNKIQLIYADLQRTHRDQNVIRLDTIGTRNDLEKHGLTLREGETYWFWRDDEIDDPLIFSGIAKFDVGSQQWLAAIDPMSITHLSQSEFAKTENN